VTAPRVNSVSTLTAANGPIPVSMRDRAVSVPVSDTETARRVSAAVGGIPRNHAGSRGLGRATLRWSARVCAGLRVSPVSTRRPRRCRWCGRFVPAAARPVSHLNVYGVPTPQLLCGECLPYWHQLGRRNVERLRAERLAP